VIEEVNTMRGSRFGVFLGILPVTLFLAITVSVGQKPFAPPVAERTWAEDDDNWEFLVNPSLGRMNSRFRAPLYIIGVVGPEAQATLDIGPHDHVIYAPPHNSGAFKAVFDVFLVLPTESALSAGLVDWTMPNPALLLARAADLDGDGHIGPGEELTSVTKVELAEEMGLVQMVGPLSLFRGAAGVRRTSE
jgi:hypothetical protein